MQQLASVDGARSHSIPDRRFTAARVWALVSAAACSPIEADPPVATSMLTGATIEDLVAVEPGLADPSVKDFKVYFTPEQPPRVVVLATTRTNAQGKITYFGVRNASGWRFRKVSHLRDVPPAFAMRSIGDAHLRFVPGSDRPWLTFGGCAPESDPTADPGSCLHDPIGFQLDPALERVVNIVPVASHARCGHEPSLACAAAGDCLGVSACDVTSAGFFGTGFRRHAAGIECPSFTSRELGLDSVFATAIGELATPRGHGVFDVLYMPASLVQPFVMAQPMRQLRLQFPPGACTPRVLSDSLATVSATQPFGALYAPVVDTTAAVAFAGGAIGYARTPEGGWLVRQDTTSPGSARPTTLRAQHLGVGGIADRAEQTLPPPANTHYLAPDVELSADGVATLFYMKWGFAQPNYEVCMRTALPGGNFRNEICVVRATFKDIDAPLENPQNLMSDNLHIGAVAPGRAAVLFMDECDGPGEEATCRLKLWLSGP